MDSAACWPSIGKGAASDDFHNPLQGRAFVAVLVAIHPKPAYARAMHANTIAGLSLVVLVAAAGIPAAAAEGAPATGTTTEAAPRLYTNADLAKFGPPAPTTAPRRETAPVDDAAAWAYVQSVLDREAARLEAEHRRSSSYDESSFPVDRGYVAGAGYYGAYGYGYNPYQFDGFGFGDRTRLGARFRSNRGFTEGLIPRGNHGPYTFLNGADVVPGPKSPGSGHHGGGKRGGGGGGGHVSHHGGGRGGGGRR